MMKAMYFLQEVYKLPLRYDFSIYTYGPYDEDVMAFLGYAEDEGLINVKPVVDHGYRGYEITLQKGDTVLSEENMAAVEEIAEHFGDYTAKQWELASTIVFAYVSYTENNIEINTDEINEDVRRIKPHFSKEEIEQERKHLEDLNILSRAIA